jgi:FkbM family methyltransferase
MNILEKLERRIEWYRSRVQVNNPVIGRAVELLGNQVWIDGFRYSVATTQISTGHKSTLLFGLHEIEERALVKRWIPPDVPLIELGGGLGVVSCLANRKLFTPIQHVVVEANPAMASILRHNRDQNRCKFEIVNRAIGYDAPAVVLNLDEEFVGSTIKSSLVGQTVSVQTASVSELMQRYGFGQAGVICDIEGAEVDVVRREFPILGERLRYLLAEIHPGIVGWEQVDEMLLLLAQLGFEKREQKGSCVFYSR